MRSKFRVCVVLALALAVAAVVLAPAATAAKGKRVTTINLTTRTAQEAELDLGTPGFGVGDRFVFSDNVFRGGRQVGVLAGECTFARLEPSPLPPGQEPTSAVVNCIATIQLPRGQITIQGLLNFSAESGNRFVLAITGGTRAYRKARGHAVLIEGDEENAPDRLRLKLIR